MALNMSARASHLVSEVDIWETVELKRIIMVRGMNLVTLEEGMPWNAIYSIEAPIPKAAM